MIVQKYFNAETKRKGLENEAYFDNRIGFWGRVTFIDSENMTCSVLSDTGFEYKNIPVVTKEWISENENYISAERNLPPINAVVFVLMPTHTISGAFIFCSGYARGNDNLKTLFSEDYNKEDKATIREKKTCSGWSVKENYESGNLSLLSHNENIQIKINPNDDEKHNEGKQILIKAWNSEIQITEKGISIKTEGDSSLRAGGDMDITVEGNLSANVNQDCNVFCEGDFFGEFTKDCDLQIEGKTNIEVKDDIEINAEGKNINIITDKFTIGESLEVVK